MEDHGTGIPLDIREHIFEPFFTTKDKSVGAGSIGKGLGLFVSHAIVQEHGGELSVESPSAALPPSPGSSGEASRAGDPGQWTRFYLDLPAVPADVPQAQTLQAGLPVMPVQDAVAHQAVGKESEAV